MKDTPNILNSNQRANGGLGASIAGGNGHVWTMDGIWSLETRSAAADW